MFRTEDTQAKKPEVYVCKSKDFLARRTKDPDILASRSRFHFERDSKERA